MSEWLPIVKDIFSIAGGASLISLLVNSFLKRKPEKADYTKKLLDIEKFHAELEARFNKNLEEERRKMETVQQGNQKALFEQTIKYQEDINRLLQQIADERRIKEFDLLSEQTTNKTLRQRIEQQDEMIRNQNEKINHLEEENRKLQERIRALELNQLNNQS